MTIKSTSVILGLGRTGLSVAQYLMNQGEAFIVADDHPSPDAVDRLKQIAPQTKICALAELVPHPNDRWIVSPGIPLTHPDVVRGRDLGVKLSNDVVIFSKDVSAPVVGITGTNGKTTVTSMATFLAQQQRNDVVLGGNIGTPCLDLLTARASAYFLELSSYQLELADGLPLRVATLLNLSPDHMDRYPSVEAYYAAKGRILRNADICVVASALKEFADAHGANDTVTFSDQSPRTADEFGLKAVDGELYLTRGQQMLLPVRGLPVQGKTHYLNALAALAIVACLDLDLEQMLDDLVRFEGLPHRCQKIERGDQIVWINDSKATNVGATQAAVASLVELGPMILLLGGRSKNADLAALCHYLAAIPSIKLILAYGESREFFSTCLQGVAFQTFEDFDQMVEQAIRSANPGDVVLLSPACASQDQFSDYEARGAYFEELLMRGAA